MSEGPDKAPFFICENIDDFDRHVLNGHLNKRGWVLQEHALAHRTIFFTEHQTYFECGDGVRCETLTKMSKYVSQANFQEISEIKSVKLTFATYSNLAAFLGDPNFPHIIMSASQGEKIIRFLNLCKTYSGLAFTKAYDRPIALDGIQSCLLKAFGMHGGYGIFAENNDKGHRPDLLRRSLLWYRPPDKKELVRIKFPQDHAGVATVPSWSWMAYMGEVDFLQPPFGNINWTAIRSPWLSSKSRVAPLDDRRGSLTLSGKVRDITVGREDETSGKLYYDTPSESQKKKTQCVVLGVEKGNQAIGSLLHYFILVQPARSRLLGETNVYERVGAGYLPGRCISTDGQKVHIGRIR
jgi:hypothetical protein